MYKMLAIDIDDTLLTDNNVITPNTKASLQQAVNHGVIVTLATGRMFSSAQKIAKELQMNVPLITYQGSLVQTTDGTNVLYERTVPQEASLFLFQYAKQHGLHLQAYVDDQLFAKEENERLIHYCQNSNVPYHIEPDFNRLASLPMTKLIMIDEPAKLDQLTDELKPKIGHLVHITKSKPNFLEFLHIEGTKGHALKFLANYYQCPLSKVMAIGDSWNDRDLLETAGFSVAMANAVEPLKQLADYITLSNNEEGVKHAIDTFIL